MTSKKSKREKQKSEKLCCSRDASVKRRRIKKAEYLLYRGARKEFKKGGSVHDVFFHLMMKDVAFATRFLNEYLPRKLRDALDLSDPTRLKILPTDYYDARVKKHVADLVFVIPCKNKDEFVALTLIVEHKAQSGATIDHKTIIQALKYAVLEVESQFKNLQTDVVYQPLVVIIYTGADSNFEAPSWESLFPLPEALQIEELQEAQIKFKPICVNLTRLFLQNKLSKQDFLRVMPEIMARASLKRVSEAYSTLFKPLGQIQDWTNDEKDRLNACANYVALTVDQPMTKEEYDSLTQSVNNDGVKRQMKTIFDLAEERGRKEGRKEGRRLERRIERRRGKIEVIQTVASLRFRKSSDKLTELLTQIKNVKLLDQTKLYALTASSLSDVEDFAEKMTQLKSQTSRSSQRDS